MKYAVKTDLLVEALRAIASRQCHFEDGPRMDSEKIVEEAFLDLANCIEHWSE
jgi:hypothetical protein